MDHSGLDQKAKQLQHSEIWTHWRPQQLMDLWLGVHPAPGEDWVGWV